MFIGIDFLNIVVSGSMDSCLMIWHFKPHLRAYRFVGHKVIQRNHRGRGHYSRHKGEGEDGR